MRLLDFDHDGRFGPIDPEEEEHHGDHDRPFFDDPPPSTSTVASFDAASAAGLEALLCDFTLSPENRASWPDVALPDELEAKLIERLIQRDERAFNELVQTYGRRVSALVLRMLGNKAEAEDLTQEVFVQVFKAIGTFRGESKLSTWIYRIAVNLCKNRSKYLRVQRALSHALVLIRAR